MSILDAPAVAARPAWLALDKLGVLIALIAGAGAALPFTLFRANRIVPGEPVALLDALPPTPSILLAGILLIGFAIALLRFPVAAKLVAGFIALAGLFVGVGWSASYLTPEGNTFARVSPGAGFWLLSFAFALLVTDALTRLRFPPLIRIAILLLVCLAMAGLLWSGAWNDLSILREYATRAPAFWAEGRTHIALAFGSVAIARAISSRRCCPYGSDLEGQPALSARPTKLRASSTLSLTRASSRTTARVRRVFATTPEVVRQNCDTVTFSRTERLGNTRRF